MSDFIFSHFGEASSGVQAALFKSKRDYVEMGAAAKARAKVQASSMKKKYKASLKVGPEAKRLKVSPGSQQPGPRNLRLVLKSSPLLQMILPQVMSITQL